MEASTNEHISKQMDFTSLGIDFSAKPIVFGGMAMEYYGLRKHGSDIDLFVSSVDYEDLAEKYPDGRKDSWGDLGVLVNGFELWKSIWKLDYAFFSECAVEFEGYYILSIEKLLLTKALAADVSEKHRADMNLIVSYIIKQNQTPDIVDYMNAHVKSYLASPDGFVYKGNY